MPDWLWQGLVTNSVYALLILAGGVMLAILQRKWPTYATPALYGVIGVACLAITFFAFTGRAVFSRQQPKTTPENVESNVKAWCDLFELGMQRVSDSSMRFVVEVHLRYNGRVLRVGVPQQSHYLQFTATLTPPPEQRSALDKLSKKQKQEVIDEVNLELERAKIGYALAGVDESPLQGILLTKSVPITDNLNEDSFIVNINEMDSVIGLADYAIKVSLEHLTN